MNPPMGLHPTAGGADLEAAGGNGANQLCQGELHRRALSLRRRGDTGGQGGNDHPILAHPP
jgi:hypothetical protein